MYKYLIEDEWLIIEDSFDPGNHKRSESLFSLGNGHMGQRANFEESYSGPSLQGNYIAGIYYPDKTRVGWWKNGYPEYFAKVLNAPDWIGMKFAFDGQELDLYKMSVTRFRRVLNMKEGILLREFEASWPDGKAVRIEVERFLSMVRKETAAIRYRITPLNFTGNLEAYLYINGDVRNQDSNYDEKFWEPVNHSAGTSGCFLQSRTRKSGFEVCTAQITEATSLKDGTRYQPEYLSAPDYACATYRTICQPLETLEFIKYAAVVTSRNHESRDLVSRAAIVLGEAIGAGYDTLKKEQVSTWTEKWRLSDIIIDGDISAQQGIRFNIFQLNQTYTGHDPLLNIGPKGFTGEKYGGSTYWDTEAFCLPFYLCTAGSHVARNLLVYRYRHLQKAIENGEKLGFSNGAALYPMVTINGEECHNEWEITFEEIHRNGAIAYAIYNYVRHTADDYYLAEYGLEVLIALSRFWSQRATFSDVKRQFVILGVTGPNEYENNVNNNWYTNFMAGWTLRYTLDSYEWVKENHPADFDRIMARTNHPGPGELQRWDTIINHLYYPEDKALGIFLQQEGYLDKEQILVSDLDPSVRPLNQNWSWDRILRSCFIKQADVLQGIYFFEEHFDLETIRRNFDFYEPRTVHESSLSPCVHSILAARLGYTGKAYDLYLRTSRLDLDDYNHEVHEGCHITSMAGTWLAVVEGFGGMEIENDEIHLDPHLPPGWTTLAFTIHFRELQVYLVLKKDEIILSELKSRPFRVIVRGKAFEIGAGKPLVVRIDQPD